MIKDLCGTVTEVIMGSDYRYEAKLFSYNQVANYPGLPDFDFFTVVMVSLFCAADLIKRARLVIENYGGRFVGKRRKRWTRA